MKGHIHRRGERKWQLKWDLGKDGSGRRQQRYRTVTGSKADAARELRRILSAIDDNAYVDVSRITIREFFQDWLGQPIILSPMDSTPLSPKTVERYRQLAEQQIYPHLGAILLQKLDTHHLQKWHETLFASGGKGGRRLTARTVLHAHRLLSVGLTRALKGRVVFRNVAAVQKPPKPEEREVEILRADQLGEVLGSLEGHVLKPIVVTVLGTGLRRGELCALRWSRTDLDAGLVRVEESLEQTKEGLRFKAPKSKAGRRTISVPPRVIEVLREHRRAQLELRVALGLGRLQDDALVFAQLDGSPMAPNNLSRDWHRFVVAKKLPPVSFHALRHTHVSALVDGGLDVFSVSRRIGHKDAALTLRVYTHLFSRKDHAAVDAIERALKV